jgi:hypothetical protein
MIGLQIYISRGIFEEQQKLGMKKVMKGVFLVSRLITWFDIIFGYLLSLIKGKKFLKFLSNEELCAIDCYTINANKIIGSLIIGSVMMATLFISYAITSENSTFESVQISYRIVFTILSSLLMAFYFFNGVFLIPVFYYCITSLFITQINELNFGLSKGIIDILCISTL